MAGAREDWVATGSQHAPFAGGQVLGNDLDFGCPPLLEQDHRVGRVVEQEMRIVLRRPFL